MSGSAGVREALVEKFVRYVHDAGLEPKFLDDVPDELRTGEESDGMVAWQIQRAELNPWVGRLIEKLPRPFPRAFELFISRYRFCTFEVGPIMFFANTGHDVFEEISTYSFKDTGLFPTLHKHGFLQFGQPSDGSYDPVCFAPSRGNRDGAPVVRLDHEQILMRGQIRVLQEIAPSFETVLKRAVSERLSIR